MKKLFFSLFCGSLLLLYVTSSFAQVVLDEVTVTPTSSKTVINEKVSKSFDRLFKNATNLKWEVNDERFVAKFIKNDQKNQASFTKNGSLVYHLTYGYEKNLPSNVRSQVKSKYFDFNITYAIKVNQDERNIWVVGMEDAKELISVRLENGEMSEIQHFTKDNSTEERLSKTQ